MRQGLRCKIEKVDAMLVADGAEDGEATGDPLALVLGLVGRL
jgi:hypothetical protein